MPRLMSGKERPPCYQISEGFSRLGWFEPGGSRTG
jgi:hypothetical protein